MERLSFDRCRRNENYKDAHVYFPVRDVGRLDEKHLSGFARPACHVAAWRVRWLPCAHYCVLPPNLAPDRDSLASSGWGLVGRFGAHPVNVAVGYIDP